MCIIHILLKYIVYVEKDLRTPFDRYSRNTSQYSFYFILLFSFIPVLNVVIVEVNKVQEFVCIMLLESEVSFETEKEGARDGQVESVSRMQ